MKFLYTLLFALFFSSSILAQTKSALFIGNSYTWYNDLPVMTSELALSAGDTLIVDSHTPSATSFEDHATSSLATDKINAQDWDYVVLQGQSQEPSFPLFQVEEETFPFAEQLCETIRENNACTRPLFFMTWGRENGDASNCPFWPPVCTYEGMDSLLRERYMMMADNNMAYVSPVGAVWRSIRDNYPDIDLYASDGSHPSPEGSYAAACTFYTLIFEADPMDISSNDDIDAEDAAIIREITKQIAYDQLSLWNVGEYETTASFTWSISTGSTFDFSNESFHADTFLWEFGDGNTSDEENPSHDYSEPGDYTVTLTASGCGSEAVYEEDVSLLTIGIDSFISEPSLDIYPNPVYQWVNITLKGNHSYTIRDIGGKVILQGKVQDKEVLNLSELESGLYFIEINGKIERLMKL